MFQEEIQNIHTFYKNNLDTLPKTPYTQSKINSMNIEKPFLQLPIFNKPKSTPKETQTENINSQIKNNECTKCEVFSEKQKALEEKLEVLQQWLHAYNTVVSDCTKCTKNLADLS